MRLSFKNPMNGKTKSILAHLEQTDQNDNGQGEYEAYVTSTDWYKLKRYLCGIKGCSCIDMWDLEVTDPDFSFFDYSWSFFNFKVEGGDMKRHPGKILIKLF